MKKRIISAIIALAIVIPLIFFGGVWFKIGVAIISMIGLYELFCAYERLNKIPIFIKILAIICFIFLIYNLSYVNDFNINISILVLPILLCILPSLFFKDKYNINNAFEIYSIVCVLGLCFGNLILIRNFDLNYFIYLLIISTMNDTFGHLVGTQIGKHKLCPSVSPQKTIEGFVGGLIFSIFISVCFLTTFSNISLMCMILMSILLSLMATFGDLIFSLIKRYYNIKDFGNIMPGHGGVLDRVDSILIVSIAFTILMNFM